MAGSAKFMAAIRRVRARGQLARKPKKKKKMYRRVKKRKRGGRSYIHPPYVKRRKRKGHSGFGVQHSTGHSLNAGAGVVPTGGSVLRAGASRGGYRLGRGLTGAGGALRRAGEGAKLSRKDRKVLLALL
jgi:hypothetical protein